jgi:hypothetical protein
MTPVRVNRTRGDDGRGQTSSADVSYSDAQNLGQYHHFLHRSCSCCRYRYLNCCPDCAVEGIAFEIDSAEDEYEEPG